MSFLERLFSVGPVRKAIWQLWYPYLTRRLRGEEVLFLNYAFETDPPVGLKLEPADEPNRACIQLYHHVATQVDLHGKDVLEVSCGHGGGASWITRTLQPASYTGLDLNPTGIAFCKKRHQVPGLRFVQGDAQTLPFPPQVFDAVINVEASHCYPDFPGFLAQVARVLKTGGHFLYADFRFRDQWAEWEQAITKAPLEIVQTRAEDYRTTEHFATVVSRAFASLPDFLRLTEQLCAPDGCWLAMKGEAPETELQALPPGLTAQVRVLQVPGLDARRCVVQINKN